MNRGEVIADRFEIEQLVGTGGMGEVFRARDRRSGTTVALKILHQMRPGQIERFHREAEVLAELHHPGVVRYVAHGEGTDRRPYLAMEWLEGEDLWQRLARGRLPMEQALEVVAQAADALAAAHERGVVHRDIKPGNLFLLQGEVRPSSVKLLDFGIARLASAAAVTRTGLAIGTPSYMAPEQARGSREIDARADVFSLGCVLYECITGRVAFPGEHPLAALGKVLLEPAPRIGEVIASAPAWLDDLLMRMLAKDPDARPNNARLVATEIERRAVDLAPPSSATQSGALTTSERRLRCVLMAAWPPGAASTRGDSDSGTLVSAGVADVAWAPTLAPVSPRMADEVHATLATWGARLEMLGEGGLVATLAGMGPPTDQTALAARCALALRELSPIRTVAVATGWGIMGDRAPVGEVIDRAAALLSAPEDGSPVPAPVLLDEMTEQLLDERFVIVHGSRGPELTTVRDDPAHLRTLLGKPSPCVGRETELAVLIGLWRECVEDSLARAVLVTAAAGVGKSRLATELVRTAQQSAPNAVVWSARGDPLSRGSPFALVAAPIRHAAGIAEGEPLEARREKLRGAVARLGEALPRRDELRVLHFLGELVGVSFEQVSGDAPSEEDDTQQIRAARRDPVLMGDQMRRAWEDFARGQADRAPLLLIIEDLHWGDLPSVHLLDGALKALADRPFLLVALARPEVLELFPNLWSERELQHIRLGDLARRASARLVRQVLGPDTPEPTVKKLVALSGGNAFYLEELIRAEASGVGELPGTVVAMAQGRLERLEPEARRLLRAASVFGQTFSPAGVARLLGAPQELVNDWMRELSHREVIMEKAGLGHHGQPEHAFRHALLREAAYEMLPPEDRAVGHRLAADWLEAAGERDAVVLAHHLERGGESGRAATCYLRAAQQALEGADHDATVARAERAIACGASGEELGAAHVMQAEAVIWRGAFPDVRSHVTIALGHLHPRSPLYFRAIGPLAFAQARLHDHAANQRLAATLTALPAAAELLAEHAIALARVARELFFARLDADGRAALARAAELTAALPEQDPGVIGWVENVNAVGTYQAGDLAAARAHAQRSVEAFRQAGDLRFVAALSTILASVCMRIGDYRRAASIYADSAALSERMRLTHVVASSRCFQARAMLELGPDAEAQADELLADTVATAHAIGDPRTESCARTFLALLHLRRGDLAAADRESSQAVAGELPHPSYRALTLDGRARVQIALGRAVDAVSSAREAYQAIAKEGELADHGVLVRVTLAEALLASGDAAEARRVIAEAQAVIGSVAARITDDEMRTSFLERVPANKRTRELAEAWSSTGEREEE